MDRNEALLLSARIDETITAAIAAVRELGAAAPGAPTPSGEAEARRALAIVRTHLETAALWYETAVAELALYR